MPNVICNTSPLQYLHQTEMLDLLPTLFGSVSIPDAVGEELEAGRKRGVFLPEEKQHVWLHRQSVQNRVLLPLVTRLGEGEREVIALGLEQPNALLLLDDRDARRHAKSLNLEVSGTLGILLLAKQQGALNLVRPVVDRLEANRFRLDAQTRLAVLALANEAD